MHLCLVNSATNPFVHSCERYNSFSSIPQISKEHLSAIYGRPRYTLCWIIKVKFRVRYENEFFGILSQSTARVVMLSSPIRHLLFLETSGCPLNFTVRKRLVFKQTCKSSYIYLCKTLLKFKIIKLTIFSVVISQTEACTNF